MHYNSKNMTTRIHIDETTQTEPTVKNTRSLSDADMPDAKRRNVQTELTVPKDKIVKRNVLCCDLCNREILYSITHGYNCLDCCKSSCDILRCHWCNSCEILYSAARKYECLDCHRSL